MFFDIYYIVDFFPILILQSAEILIILNFRLGVYT